MIRYTGIILVSGAISMYGTFASLKIKAKASQRKGLIELLYAIKNGIEYGGVSLEQIYTSFYNSALDKCGFINELQSKSPNALENALSSKGMLLNDAERSVFFDFAKKCGKGGFVNAEKELCCRCIAQSEALDRRLTQDENAKCMLYQRLGILCGLMFALIML